MKTTLKHLPPHAKAIVQTRLRLLRQWREVRRRAMGSFDGANSVTRRLVLQWRTAGHKVSRTSLYLWDLRERTEGPASLWQRSYGRQIERVGKAGRDAPRVDRRPDKRR